MSASSTLVGRVLSVLAGALLIVVALLHASGYARVVEVIGEAALPSFYDAAFKVQWLFFSWHVVVLALVALWVGLVGATLVAAGIDRRRGRDYW